jgi:dTDP-4-dehydrorhamnose reductase
MRVLVVGAGGQLGQALVSSAPDNVELIACSHKDLDVADPQAVSACVRHHHPEVIVNAAAYTAVDRAEAERELAQRINADGPRHLAVAAGTFGARFLHISTDFVFDGRSSLPYRPDAPTNPLSVYGQSKRAGEEAVLEVLPERSLILRTAWVYAGQGRNFVLTMLHLMRTKGAVRVIADQVGTPSSARSIAEAVWGLTERPGISGIHHWTDAGVASWYDFAVAIAEEGALLGLVPDNVVVTPIATADYPTPARRPSYSVLDKTSLISLGFTPIHWRKRLRGVLAEMKRG